MKIDRHRLRQQHLRFVEGEDGGGDPGSDPKDNSKAPAEGENGGEDPDPNGEQGGDGFTPITTQEDLNRVLSKRLERERSKFSDYDELKTQVASLTTENTGLKESLAKESRQGLLARVSAETGVDQEYLKGDTEEELKASADRLLSFVAAAVAAQTGGNQPPAGWSPHTGTGSEKPPAPSQEQGREAARAALAKSKRKEQGS